MIRELFTQDHRHCDDMFAAVETALRKSQIGVAQTAFLQFQEAMLKHFSTEEELLFPAFEEKTGMTMGPTRVMRMEHQQMRDLLAEANEALQTGNCDDYAGYAETLLIMMQQHNLKEENVLYPMCDTHLENDWDRLQPIFVQALASGKA